MIGSGAQAQTEVAPIIGDWNYGENRCATVLYGYSSEDEAVDGGAYRHYTSTRTCEWSATPYRDWGSQESQTSGSCGSTQYYPKFTLGIESTNTRPWKISYRYGSNCAYGPTSDGLTVYRSRSVTCPTGYVASATKKACVLGTAVIPTKSNPSCPAGTNGSNPIHNALGYKLQTERDFDAGGGLRMVRYYSSASHWGSTPMGVRWRHNFLRSIRLSDLADVGGPVTAWVQRHDGDRLPFNRTADGTWVSHADVPLILRSTVSESGAFSGWELTTCDNEVESYDAQGRLNAIDYPDGARVLVEYVDGQVSLVSNAAGRSIEFQYEAGRLAVVVAPDGAQYHYTHDETGNLRKLEVENDGVLLPGRDYFYDDTRFPNALTGIDDESGSRYGTWEYDSSGRATLSVHGDASIGVDRVSLTFNSDGTTSVVGPLGDQRKYSFATSHGVRRATSQSALCTNCGGSQAKSATYDANGYPDKVTDFLGNVTDHDYDSRGREVRRVDTTDLASKRTVETDWHPRWRAMTARRVFDHADALVDSQVWILNLRGQPTASCRFDVNNPTAMAYVCGTAANAPAGVRQSRSTYCEQSDVDAGTCPRVGLLIASDGPRTDVSDVTTYRYYAEDEASCATAPATCPYRKGDLWKVTNAKGQPSEILRYDGAGRVLSQRDANGIVTDSEYHPRGWLSRRIVRGDNDASEADDRITRMDYWPTGQVEKVTQPDGSFTRFEYDAAHRLTDIYDGEGNHIHYVLDNAGNRVKEETFDSTDALRRELSRIYNQLGQLETQASADATPTVDYTYDAAGRVDTTTDALGRVTDNDYDALGRLRQTIQDVAGINASTEFEYDALDRLREVIDPKGLSTVYGYSPLGDLESLSSPDTGTTGYTYDSAGNRKTQTDARGITSTYSYDVLGRLTSVSYPTSSLNVSYVYDTVNAVCAADETFAAGRLAKITDSSGSTEYCYDRWGQLVRKVQITAGKTFTLRYGYSAAGRLTSVTYPSGARADLTRNALGQTTGLDWQPLSGPSQVLLSNVRYHAFGPASALVYGDGRTLRRTLDMDYQPDVIEDVGNGGLSLGYGFDYAGNLTTLRDGNQSEPPLRRFGYDGLNRLTTVQDGNNALLQDYGYDATGNRTRVGSTDYAYAADSHRLLGVGGSARSYDEAGNTTLIPAPVQGFTVRRAAAQAVKPGLAPSSAGALVKGQPVSNLSLKKGNDVVYSLSVPAGASDLRFDISGGKGNADLYVRFGSAPTDSTYNCRPYLNGNQESCSFANPSAGTYYVRLKARTNFSGVSLVGDYTAVIPNQPPVASFSFAATDLSVDFTDSSTDSDGTLVAYAWSFGDGNTSTAANPSHTYTAAGTYTVSLTVTDDDGATASTSQPVSVSAAVANGSRTFVYNDANRMAQVLSGATVLADYVYNGKGEQVVRSADGELVFFVYDEAGQLLGQYDSNGTAIQEYVWLDSMPVGVAANGALYYVEPDHLGTPRAVIDPSRQVAVWSWPLTGEVFGADAPNQDADGDGIAFNFDLRFPGQRFDAASGLNYNYFRDYEPGTGRYIESDPVGLKGGMSTYGYSGQDPLYFTDPLGLWCVPLPGETTEWSVRSRRKNLGNINTSVLQGIACIYHNAWFVTDERQRRSRSLCFECTESETNDACGPGRRTDCNFRIKYGAWQEETRERVEAERSPALTTWANMRQCSTCRNPFTGIAVTACDGDVQGGDNAYKNPRNPYGQ